MWRIKTPKEKTSNLSKSVLSTLKQSVVCASGGMYKILPGNPVSLMYNFSGSNTLDIPKSHIFAFFSSVSKTFLTVRSPWITILECNIGDQRIHLAILTSLCEEVLSLLSYWICPDSHSVTLVVAQSVRWDMLYSCKLAQYI